MGEMLNQFENEKWPMTIANCKVKGMEAL